MQRGCAGARPKLGSEVTYWQPDEKGRWRARDEQAELAVPSYSDLSYHIDII